MRELGIQIGERSFEHLAMIGILGRFQLLKHTLARKQEALFPPLICQLFRCQPSAWLTGRGRSLRLLLFD